MAEVTKIELVLENGEAWEFERKDIGEFECSGIHRIISSIGCNRMMDYEECDEFFIELFSSADVPKKSLYYDKPKSPFERLSKYADITSVEIMYNNGTSECIEVPFDGGFNIPGTTQTCYLSDAGNLYIRVSKKGGVKGHVTELLDLSKVDDIAYMNFKREMYHPECLSHQLQTQ